MKGLRFLSLIAWLAGSLLTVPAQAAGFPTPPLTFDLLCDGPQVCRIQNASLDSLNGQVIWFYTQIPVVATGAFESEISLELPGGASRGTAFYGSNGGYFSLGRNNEGSLDRFQTEGTFARSAPGMPKNRLMFHYAGQYPTN